MNEQDIETIHNLLESPKNVVIVPHKNPDGDAVGSCLGLYHYLKLKGHYPTVVCPNDYPEFLKWLPGAQNTLKFDENRDRAQKAIEQADLIFTLDFNHFSRVDDMQTALQDAKATFVMIDHHQAPDHYALVTYSDVTMSSTCEMVYHFISYLNDDALITPDIANCLYAGIMTDTGSFRFPVTTSKTHRVIADLIDKGAENSEIHNHIYDSNSLNKLHLLGIALNNLTIIDGYHTAFITLTKEELNSCNFQKGDTEGFVNYALSINGIKFAAIFIENITANEEYVKISLRSKGDFDVNTFARTYFNGGGHKNAAGGRSNHTLQETIANFREVVTEHKLQLTA